MAKQGSETVATRRAKSDLTYEWQIVQRDSYPASEQRARAKWLAPHAAPRDDGVVKRLLHRLWQCLPFTGSNLGG